VPSPRLHVIHSRYRNLNRPIRHFVERIEKEHPDRQVAVIIPELVKTSWWHYLLHNRRAARLRWALVSLGHPRIAVITLPWPIDPRQEEVHAGEGPRPV